MQRFFSSRFAVAATILLLIVGVLILMSGGRPESQDVGEGESGTVYIENGQELHDMLFDLQYYAVRNTLSDYIIDKISGSVDSAAIVGSPTVPDNGLIEFRVETKNPDEEFTVKLDRNDTSVIKLEIPETKFKKTISVYEAGSDPENH